ncbi:MAG: YfhO family protein [Massilibacteroides sp.]|nr:YfhO family protein [Massilibacteroides sp.]MDD3062276.1 YfhO family protein [Massilibacteroides sp.]MDD4113985.1 YfhO family protein [Massilibacteroides sp.]MDD4660049.1 YfhO family protein [Massilibacteroides sp.]
MNIYLKKNIGHIFAIFLFCLLVVLYFYPAIFEGKTTQQGDVQKFIGMAQELKEYAEKENGKSAWTGAMFSGMPAYHISVFGDPVNAMDTVQKPLKMVDPEGGSILLIAMISFYILMCVLKTNRWLAIAGAIAFAFASYNIIIIVAGHITKAYVIAYMPLTIAGMVLLFKRNQLLGGVLFILGVALSVLNFHVQITYYLLLLCLFIYMGYLVTKIQQKEYTELLKISLIMVASVMLAILPNIKNIYANWESSAHSTRGATELATTTVKGEKISSGLDKNYAFQWSYQKRELLTLLIPNAYGGASIGTLGPDSELYQAMRKQGAQVGKEVQSYTYWGDKTTSGPVYFGALVCFLFVFGMFVVRSPYKWWLFGGALFLTFLALGRYMDWFNNIIFHYLPLYNKFRTVEMALVIPGLVFPIIAIWGLKDLLADNVDMKLFKRGMIGSLAITGGLCLIVWLMPNLLLNFSSELDVQRQLPDWYIQPLMLDRASLASADAFRSLVFILLGAALLFLYWKSNDKKKMGTVLSAGVAILILVDLWTVDKRFLSNDDFVKEKPHETYKESVADQAILEDKDPSYRVLNLNDPFQETSTSYFHKSIGGYHAAKLRRYQELIDHRLAPEINGIISSLQKAQTIEDIMGILAASPSLNMLNTRYIIYNPEQPPIRNPYAYGNAWFVPKVKLVENADAEIAALNEIDPLKTGIVDKRFAASLEGFRPVADSTATIMLTAYRPNRLTYSTESASDQLAVFSEVYYQPGWGVTIDGKPASHFRADWTLRAMIVPAGKHEIIFEFYPKAYVVAANISSYSSFLILLLLCAAIGYSIWRKRKQKKSRVHRLS